MSNNWRNYRWKLSKIFILIYSMDIHYNLKLPSFIGQLFWMVLIHYDEMTVRITQFHIFFSVLRFLNFTRCKTAIFIHILYKLTYLVCYKFFSFFSCNLQYVFKNIITLYGELANYFSSIKCFLLLYWDKLSTSWF